MMLKILRNLVFAMIPLTFVNAPVFSAQEMCGVLEANPPNLLLFRDLKGQSWTIIDKYKHNYKAYGVEKITQSVPIGNTCACISVDVQSAHKLIRTVYSAKPASASQCFTKPRY